MTASTNPLLLLLGDDETELLRERLRLDREAKSIEARKKEIDDRLKEVTGNAEAGVVHGHVVFTFSPVVSRVLDQKSLKEHAPDLAEKFTVERVTRPFRVTKEAAEVLG